jgi:hypothetical protein
MRKHYVIDEHKSYAQPLTGRGICFAVAINGNHNRVLLQLDDAAAEQIRIVMTKDEASLLVELLTEAISEVKE